MCGVFRIKTLTPIWTGGVDGECTKLRETSIIGSLRWWFEVIVRGFGGYACDPTSNNKCEYRGDVKDICAVCELFGTTGWAKRFKFEIKQHFSEIYESTLVISENKNWYHPSGLVSCHDESNTIKLVLRTERNINSILRVLFNFISNWGMIGGKTAIGYGVVRFENENGKPIRPTKKEKEVDTFFKYLLEEKRDHGKNAINTPRLSEMFFARFKIKEDCINKVIGKIERSIKHYPASIFKCNGIKENITTSKEFLKKLKDYYGFIPSSALIRKELRKRIRNRWQSKDKLRHFLMGNVQTKKGKQKEDPTRFSATQISHIYWDGKNWEFRVWGWVPRDISRRLNNNSSNQSLGANISRDDIINFIKQTFNDNNFWQNCIGINNSCFDQTLENKIIVEYPEKGWNFIDFGNMNQEEIKESFSKIIYSDKNE